MRRLVISVPIVAALCLSTIVAADEAESEVSTETTKAVVDSLGCALAYGEHFYLVAQNFEELRLGMLGYCRDTLDKFQDKAEKRMQADNRIARLSVTEIAEAAKKQRLTLEEVSTQKMADAVLQKRYATIISQPGKQKSSTK